MMTWQLVGVIALTLFVGVVIGDFEGVTRGYFHALKNPPNKRIEIKPIVYWHEWRGWSNFSIRLVKGRPEDIPIVWEWPEYFLYEPPQNLATTSAPLPAQVAVTITASNAISDAVNKGGRPHYREDDWAWYWFWVKEYKDEEKLFAAWTARRKWEDANARTKPREYTSPDRMIFNKALDSSRKINDYDFEKDPYPEKPSRRFFPVSQMG